MKKILPLLLVLIGLQATAQQFQPYNFAGDGFNITAGFPGRPSKDFKNNSNSKMLTLTETSNGVTYALILTNTESNQVASLSATNTVQKLWSGARQRDLQQPSSAAGVSSTYMKYISSNGTYVISQTFSSGVMMCQAMVLQKNNYANDYSSNNFFSSIAFGGSSNNNSNYNPPGAAYRVNDKVEVFYQKDGKWYPSVVKAVNNNGTYRISYDGYSSNYDEDVTSDRIRALSNVPANNNPGNYPVTTNGNYEKNQRVEVWDGKTSKWYGAIVLKVNSNRTYHISFDGYAENYDEDVTADRIRNMTTTTAPANIPYIILKRFGKTSIDGNLSTGYMMDDLSWATSSQLACWPSIRDIEFEGKHVGYWFDLPEKSVVKITVTPKRRDRRINIYGYAGFDLKTIPPQLPYTNICEASHPEWIGQPNLNEPSKPQTIQFNTTTRRTTIYFAVAGARNVWDGDYTITIDID